MLHAAEKASVFLQQKFDAWYEDITTNPDLDPELQERSEILRKPAVKAAYQENITQLSAVLRERLSESYNETDTLEVIRLYIHDILLADVFGETFFATVDFSYVYFEQFIKNFLRTGCCIQINFPNHFNWGFAK